MGKYVFIFFLGFLSGTCYYYPNVLSDKNSFLKDFMDVDIINVLGFVTSITLASASNMYIGLKRSAQPKNKFANTIAALKKSCIALVCILIFSFFLVVSKPLLGTTEQVQAIINSLGIILVILTMWILLDLTRAIFRMPA